MKVLKGTLRETRYSFPDQDSASSVPAIIKETTYKENEVTYMSDELGLHKISNPNLERMAVSLHRMYCLFHTVVTGDINTLKMC
jgi:cysteine dioxygenase